MLNILVCSENCNACWKRVLKVSVHVENCNASSKLCWIFQGMLKNILKISRHVENCNMCWKLCWNSMLNISVCVENCNASSKLCWIFQGMLKTVICIENYVETACWKFQCVLKTVMHAENYVEISRCVENVYGRHVENRVVNFVEIRKNHHHTSRWVLKLSGRGPKIRQQTARFDSEFTRISEVRHIYIQGSHSTWKTWKTWKNESTPGKPGNIMEFEKFNKYHGKWHETWENLVATKNSPLTPLKQYKIY